MSEFRILDTYKAYKVREKRFTGWLREKATKIGTPTSSKEKIRISEIPSIVKNIVKSGTEIPENLADTLRDVISQRKEASIFYQGKGESDEGHAHYVTVLEGALKTFEKSKSAESWSKKGKSGSSVALSGTTDVSFNNVFDLLPVESAQNMAGEALGSEDDASEAESEKENLKAPKKVRGKKKSGKNKGKGKKPTKTTEKAIAIPPPAVVDSGLSNDLDDADDDLYFMIYCFFKDFNIMREYLQERWCDYQDGLLSLTTVSVITNTTFELLQRGERELLQMMPPRHPLRSYKNMSDMLFFQVGLAHVDYDAQDNDLDDPEKTEEAFTEEADWICLNRFWDLQQFLQRAPPGKVAFDPRGFAHAVDYKSGKGEDKMKADKMVLTDILIEATQLKAMKANNASIGTLPGEDEFTIGAIQFHATRRIPIWFILACQIQCDIRYILEGNAKHCHEELLAAGNRAKKILTEYVEFQEDFENHLPSLDRLIRTTQRELDCWLLNDFVDPGRQSLARLHKFTGELEQYSYLKRNPVLCGLMVFRFALTMNELGMNNANGWGTITAAGHLYSAMQHTTPDLPRWHDLDTLLQIHTAPTFFYNAIPPSSPSGFISSYEKASSGTMMVDQRPNRNSNQVLVKNTKTGSPCVYKQASENAVNQNGIGVVSKISALYHERFCFDHITPIRNLPLVEKILNHTASTEITQTLAGVREILMEVDALPKTPFSTTPSAREISNRDLITNQFQTHNTLTSPQLLSVLCTRLQQETYTLNFDYFGFHIRCMRFLQAVYEEFKEEIIAEIGELDMGKGELNQIVYSIFTWLMDEGKAGDVKERLSSVLWRYVEKEGRGEIDALKGYMDGLVLGREERLLNGW